MTNTDKYKIGGFKYPTTDNIKSRTSTIARSMACTLAYRKKCTEEQKIIWCEIMWPDSSQECTCAYCGAKATHLDHLHPLIKDGYPTGWGSEPGNLVPCCGRCNQSKGNENWEDFMNSDKCKHVDGDCAVRKKRIKELIDKLNPTQIDWHSVDGFDKDWKDAYAKCCNALSEAQIMLEKYK